MAQNDKEGTRRETTSCGALPWRRHDGRHQVLLIKQFANQERWGVPKGHVHQGESFKDCAVREVREETGVTVVLGARLSDAVVSSKSERKTVVTYLATVVGSEEPHISDPDNEVADARWFDIEDLPELVTYQRAVIEEGVEAVRRTERTVPEAT